MAPRSFVAATNVERSVLRSSCGTTNVERGVLRLYLGAQNVERGVLRSSLGAPNVERSRVCHSKRLSVTHQPVSGTQGRVSVTVELLYVIQSASVTQDPVSVTQETR